MTTGDSRQITCPVCKAKFPLEKAVLQALQQEWEVPLKADAKKEWDAEKKKLLEEADKIREETQRQLEQKDQKLEKEKGEIKEAALKQAQEASAKQVSELTSLFEKSKNDLKEARSAEIKFREERRQWKEKEEQLDLSIQRKIDEFTAAYDEKHTLRDTKKDEQMSRMSKTIEELQRQVEQGSQQLAGEVLEITLEERLKTCFPQDKIVPVPIGMKGADLIQEVNGNMGVCCGTIIWESKNTLHWSPQWIEKLRENQQSEKADIAIIASAVLPDSIEHFGPMEGIWVTHWSLATQVARPLRMALIKLNQSKITGEAKEQKMETLYNYLMGPEFKQRIDIVVRAFMKMRQELNQERAAMGRIWNRREKQIELVEQGTTGLYGDLEAIGGTLIPQIEALSLTYQLGEGGNEE